MLADPFNGAWTTSSMLTNADLRFQAAAGSDGATHDVSQSTLTHLMDHPDREVRRTAWENYHDQYLAFKNTLAAAYGASLKQSVFGMRARRYDSTLAASLFPHDIPTAVFHNLIDVFRQNLPTWRRYWAFRRRALGLDILHPYDVWAPLAANSPQIPFEQAVEWICQGLAPLGDDYVAIMRRGCLQERWIDLYPNVGKSQGAFSTGAPGTHPFIMMSYTDSMRSFSTLAHELGHSMHSYLTWKHQPVVYGDYSLFAAEVASNFHQAMVRGHLLRANPDPAFQISLIEEAMSNFHRYFLVMPTLARFELEMHQRAEAGLGLTADFMIDRMTELFAEAYGPDMHIDHDRLGITWATFGHLYADYYVFQYATGISGAHACAQRILDGVDGAAADYRRFLSAGGSLHPLAALALAGVDLSRPEAVEATFAVLSDYVDRLEKLVGPGQAA
jgi:oligoendopeptidase F